MNKPLCLLCLWLPLAGLSQPLTLVWHRIAGGGVTSPAGAWQLQATVGQAEANGGGSPLSVGYWNLISGGALTASDAGLVLVSSANPSGFQVPVSFTASVTVQGVAASAATGTVQFLTNGVAAGAEVGLSAGTATLTLATLPAGATDITAVYSGDANYTGAADTISQVVTNLPPVAQVYVVTRTAGLALHIFWSNVATNWSDPYGYPVTLAGLNPVTAKGVTVLANSVQILYPASASNVNDQVTYTLTDGQGTTNTGDINIVVNPFVTGTQAPLIAVGSGTITASFYGIPGYVYEVQRSTNLVSNGNWVDISTNTVGENGLIQVLDAFADLGGGIPANAYYRLKWQP